MYAIVEINGQQFKAEAGKKLFINHCVMQKRARLLSLTRFCSWTTREP